MNKDKPLDKISWTKKKPKFDKECLLIVATKFSEEMEYTIYQIKKVEFNDQWYFGWLTGEGEEYGDLSDMRGDFYYVMPLLNQTQNK